MLCYVVCTFEETHSTPDDEPSLWHDVDLYAVGPYHIHMKMWNTALAGIMCHRYLAHVLASAETKRKWGIRVENASVSFLNILFWWSRLAGWLVRLAPTQGKDNCEDRYWFSDMFLLVLSPETPQCSKTADPKFRCSFLQQKA